MSPGTVEARSQSAGARSLWRVLGTVAIVIGTTATLLRALDLFGRAVVDTAELSFASTNELEAASGERLILPAYFPQTLSWPPTSIRSAGGRRPTAAMLSFSGRDRGAPRLVLAQSLRSPAPIPAGLLPPSTQLDEEELLRDGLRARLSRVLAQDGVVWRQVSFRHADRSLLLRSRGSVDELLKMAASVRREGP